MGIESGLENKQTEGAEDGKPYPAEVLESFYNKLYSREKHDSPDASRTSMVRRIKNLIFSETINPAKILNIGSGPQALEKQLLGNGQDLKFGRELEKYQFTTIDLAKIAAKKFLAQPEKNVSHARANATELPFPDKCFGLVVSNHAIDFCPQEEAFKEAHRVLNDEGKGIFYFHHPSMLREFPDNAEISAFWQYLKDNSILFNSEEEITDFLEKMGFSVEEVSVNSDKNKIDTWWEVTAKKKPELSKKFIIE